MKLVVAIHHHRHGVDVYLYDLEPDATLTEDDVIERLGEQFEADREEWVELFGPFSKNDIKKVEA